MTVYECGICGLTKSEDIPVDAKAHDWDGWKIISGPTDEVTGLAGRVCKLNEEHIEREELPALTDEDFWERGEYTAPKCVEDGAQVYICVYGEFAAVIPQTGHKLVTDNRVEPTCEDTGLTEGNHCEVCGEVLDEQKIIPAVGHSLGDWQSDGAKHWKVCGKCGVINKEDVHIWDNGLVTAEPEKDKEGEMLFKCTVCDESRIESIPVKGEPENPNDPDEPDKPENPIDPENGNISKEVVPGENAPETEMETPLEKLIEAVLTHEEREKIENGTDIKIILTVDDGTELAPEKDKERVKEALQSLSHYKLGQYLDVNLLKIIGGEQAQKITDTTAPIKIVFEIPSALRGKSEYSVIRVHGSEAITLADQDNDPDTVTILTDKFSTYALVYKEKSSGTRPSAPSGGNMTGGNNTSTDDSKTTDGDSTSDSQPAHGDSSAAASSNDSNPTSDAASQIGDDISGKNYTEQDANPATGIAVSLIPLSTAVTLMFAFAKRKKK